MPIVIKIPQALDKVLGDEASNAFVDVLNQIDSTQRNGLERALDLRLQTFKESIDQQFVMMKESIDQQFVLTNERIKLSVKEANQYTDQRITELEARIRNRFAESDTKMEKRFGEVEVKMEKRFSELEVKIAQSNASLIKWMFTFYLGSVVTIAGLIIAYLQLFLKQ